MQHAFCHTSQRSWSVIHKIFFINPAFCSEKQTNKQTKSLTPQVFLRIFSAVGSSTRITWPVLQTRWHQPSSWYSVWDQDSVPSLTRRGYKVFWDDEMRITIQNQNEKNIYISNFILIGDRMRLH